VTEPNTTESDTTESHTSRLAARAPVGVFAAVVAAALVMYLVLGRGRWFYYDEWDHVIGDYRAQWCQLREIAVPDDAGVFFEHALMRNADLVPELRRCFQQVRPDRYRSVRGLEDGENIDWNAAVEARVERRVRGTASTKLYTARVRQEREVATLFLLDMSASTDEAAAGSTSGERIIDIAKDALVIMASALEEIGDTYAIYGFSGQGRDRVEVFPVKAFGERLSPAIGVVVEVRLVERLSVDRDAALVIAADDVVAGHADHALDEVLFGRIGTPLARSLEHDDLAAVRVTEVIDQLVDQDPVIGMVARAAVTGRATLQRVLHRGRWDVERLDQERLDQQRQHQRHDHQEGQLTPERTA